MQNIESRKHERTNTRKKPTKLGKSPSQHSRLSFRGFVIQFFLSLSQGLTHAFLHFHSSLPWSSRPSVHSAGLPDAKGRPQATGPAAKRISLYQGSYTAMSCVYSGGNQI